MEHTTGVRNRALDLVIVAGAVAYFGAVVSQLYGSPWLLSLLVLPVPAVLATRLKPAGLAASAALFGALVGPATEAACIAGGLWKYAETGGLPLIPP